MRTNLKKTDHDLPPNHTTTEPIMEPILQVVQIIAFSAVSVLCVYLVAVLIRVRKILDVVAEDLKQISAKALPVLDNLEVITDRVKIITESIGDQVDSLKQAIGSFKQIAENVLAFEQRVQDQVEEPVMSAVESVASIVKGVQSFIERIPFVGRLRA